jgi:hypothetical protein
MTVDRLLGAPLTYRDLAVGSIESVERDTSTGAVQALLVRSGRAADLIRIDAQLVELDNDSGQWRIDPDAPLDMLEQEAMDSGRLPPLGPHLSDGGSV